MSRNDSDQINAVAAASELHVNRDDGRAAPITFSSSTTTRRWRLLSAAFQKSLGLIQIWIETPTEVVPVYVKRWFSATLGCSCPLCGLKNEFWTTTAELTTADLECTQALEALQAVELERANLVSVSAETTTTSATVSASDVVAGGSASSSEATERDARIAELEAENKALRLREEAALLRAFEERVRAFDERVRAFEERVQRFASQLREKALELQGKAVLVASFVKDIHTYHHREDQALDTVGSRGNETMMGSQLCSTLQVDPERIDARPGQSTSDANRLAQSNSEDDEEGNDDEGDDEEGDDEEGDDEEGDDEEGDDEEGDDEEGDESDETDEHGGDEGINQNDDNERNEAINVGIMEDSVVSEDSTIAPQEDTERVLKIESADPPKDLVTFHNHLTNYFELAKVPESMDTYKQDIQNAMFYFRDYQGTSSSRIKNPAVMPVNEGKEVDGCHPLIYIILFEVASIVKKDVHLTQEQVVLFEEGLNPRGTMSRRIDMVANRVAEHLRAIFSFMYFFPIEVKPLGRKKVPLRKVLAEGGNQVKGHLSRRSQHFFHFAGIGVNRKCRGAVLTLVSIKVYEMELRNVGTRKVKLYLRRTKTLSLFDEKTTTMILGGKDTRPINFEMEKNLPKGFLILAKLLSGPSEECGFFTSEESITFRDSSGIPRSLNLNGDNYLGAGSFGVVYKWNENEEDSVVKIPKSFRAVPSLRKEAKVLGHFDHPNIPKAIGMVRLKLRANDGGRCDVGRLDCLRLKGLVGTAASRTELSLRDINMVVNSVKQALDHAHERGYVHLDVRPSNIIVKKNADRSVSVQLIDWGCAANMREKLTGFRGSLPFCHREIFNSLVEQAQQNKKRKKIWKAKPKHDFESLAYTVAVLYHRKKSFSEVPWCGLNNNAVVDEGYLELRDKLALALLQSSSGLSTETKTFLIDAICDQVQPQAAALRGDVQPQAAASQGDVRPAAAATSRGTKRKRSSQEANLI